MKDHDPGHNPSDDDPSMFPDIPQIDELVDDEGYSWLAIGIESTRSALLDKFAECVMQVNRKYPDLDMNDLDQYAQYARELMNVMETVTLHPDLDVGDWIQVRGLDHYIQSGDPCPIPEGAILSGQYADIALCPHHQYDPSTQSMREQLPLGVCIIVTGLCYVTETDEFEEIDGVRDDEQILLTMHGGDVRISKLVPFDEEYSEPTPIEAEDHEGYTDKEMITYAKVRSSYPEVDTSGGYSLN